MLSIPQWSSREFPFSGRARTPFICVLMGKVDAYSMMCDYEVDFAKCSCWSDIDSSLLFSQEANWLFIVVSFRSRLSLQQMNICNIYCSFLIFLINHFVWNVRNFDFPEPGVTSSSLVLLPNFKTQRCLIQSRFISSLWSNKIKKLNNHSLRQKNVRVRLNLSV